MFLILFYLYLKNLIESDFTIRHADIVPVRNGIPTTTKIMIPENTSKNRINVNPIRKIRKESYRRLLA